MFIITSQYIICYIILCPVMLCYSRLCLYDIFSCIPFLVTLLYYIVPHYVNIPLYYIILDYYMSIHICAYIYMFN